MAKKINDFKNVDELSIAAIRATCIDGINKAKSGHPGMCLSAAPIVYSLFKDFLVANPYQSKWINRDRFVMSCGHGSMLYYTMLHLCGYNIKIDDLKSFRQLDSITPGHPEYGLTDGIDAGSGPLGQGIAQAVGMAMAETKLQAMYGKNIYNHYTYCLCGDGCLEEGISQEAISFAGLQKLNKLILLYDKNDVTLDGPLAQSSDEDVINRFLACHWNVVYCKKGNSYKKVKKAIAIARKNKNAPTVVIFKTIIGLGSKNQGTSKVHGSPLGEEDGRNAKLSYGYDYPPFEIPSEVYDNFKNSFIKRGEEAYSTYQNEFSKLQSSNHSLAKQIMKLSTNDVSRLLQNVSIPENILKDNSTRNTSGEVLNIFSKLLPNTFGGSADVAGSVKTALKGETDYAPNNRNGKNINWGIREFFMSSAANGILLHGGLRTYVGSFMVFADYCKAAIRMSALEQLPNIYLFSHDSIAVGEDGPTHQPIEQIAMLRSIPNLYTMRPADAREVFASYNIAFSSTNTPSAILLSRQDLPLLEGSDVELAKKGGYVVSKEGNNRFDFTLIASGSEVSLAINIKKVLESKGYGIRVVSMPCLELFDKQPLSYQYEVLGGNYKKRAFIEMSTPFGLHKYANYVFGIDEFGLSGKANQVIERFGFTTSRLAKEIENLL